MNLELRLYQKKRLWLNLSVKVHKRIESENKFEELRILKTFASLIFKSSSVQTQTHKNEQKQQQQKEREEGKGQAVAMKRGRRTHRRKHRNLESKQEKIPRRNRLDLVGYLIIIRCSGGGITRTCVAVVVVVVVHELFNEG
jgi:hypothetical protein